MSLQDTSKTLFESLNECRRRLGDLRNRADVPALSVAMFRLEAPGTIPFHGQAFSRVLAGKPYEVQPYIGLGESFSLGFYPLADDLPTERILSALNAVERITGELIPLLRELPRSALALLRLPQTENWWRIVFHLGWHLPRAFLRPTRRRLLGHDAVASGIREEVVIQLHGMARTG